MNTRLLVVEPDQAVRDALRAHFHKDHFEMSVLYSGTGLVNRVEQELPSAIVMRAELPLSESHAALRRLRAAGYDVPVIMISQSTEVIDKIIAFELGADDFLVEPFDLRELSARIRNVLRRRTSTVYAAPEIRERYAFGDYLIDFATRRLIRNGHDVGLRSSEFALLKMFASNPLKILSRSSIIGLLGKRDSGHAERGLDVLVFRLRSIVEPDPANPRYIQTLRGRGYIFVPCGEVNEPAETREVSQTRVMRDTPQRAPLSTDKGASRWAWSPR